jgi:hypothetical protein
MATTEEMNKKDAAEFAAAYGEDHKPAEQSDDAAFGLNPDEVPGTDTPTGNAPTVSIDLDKSGDGAEGTPAEEAAETPGQEAAEPAGDNVDAQGGPASAAAAPTLDVEKETQRLKSWEGRLKAQQAELDRAKAGAAAPGEGGNDPEDAADGGADEAAEGEGAGEGDEGAMDDPEMKALSEDFGEEFVELLVKVITKVSKRCAAEVAGEHSGPVRQDIDAIIAEIKNEKQRNHFERIADAHPDFADVANSDEFKAWVAAMAPADKAEAERVATAGTAKEIITLLQKYKASKASDDSDMSFAMDQAEGVRSTGGLKLPETPAASQDYEKAWNEH